MRQNFVARSKVISGLVLCILFLLMWGCAKKTPIKPEEDKQGIAFYFLADTTLKVWDVDGADLATLELQDEPWIDKTDIAFYDWSCHFLYMKNEWTSYFPVEGELGLLSAYMNNRPFVVMADDEPCYLANVNCMGGGGWDWPVIDEVDLRVSQDDNMMIRWIWFGQEDMRLNQNIRVVLDRDGLFAPGVAVDFDTLTPFIIYPGDTTKITYTYTVTNLESTPLYLFDQDKSGALAFENYNIGPVLHCLENGKYYYSIDEYGLVEDGDWSIEGWYTCVEPGDEIRRTWTAAYDLSLPEGQYLLSWPYHAPYGKTVVTSRSVPAGRLWMGSSQTPIYGIDIGQNVGEVSCKKSNAMVNFSVPMEKVESHRQYIMK